MRNPTIAYNIKWTIKFSKEIHWHQSFIVAACHSLISIEGTFINQSTFMKISYPGLLFVGAVHVGGAAVPLKWHLCIIYIKHERLHCVSKISVFNIFFPLFDFIFPFKYFCDSLFISWIEYSCNLFFIEKNFNFKQRGWPVDQKKFWGSLCLTT